MRSCNLVDNDLGIYYDYKGRRTLKHGWTISLGRLMFRSGGIPLVVKILYME